MKSAQQASANDGPAYLRGTGVLAPHTGVSVTNDDEKARAQTEMFTSKQALLFALAYRVIVALFIMRSADAPDEWYQSVEVAYSVVFGRGELTWEWREGIRSFLYPLPIAAGFWVLKVLGLDSAWAVFAVPRVYAGVICGLIDWSSYAVARKFMHPSVLCGQVAYALSLTAWYNVFMGCRTLTNVVEGLMLLAAFLPESLDGFLFFAGLGCGMRATFAVPLVPNLLERVRVLVSEAQEAAVAGGVARHMQPASGAERERVQRAAAVRCLVGVAARCAGWAVFWVAAIACVDYVFYGRWICTPWAFLHFNVFRGLSSLFGVNPWWWYLPLIPLIVLVPTLFYVGLPAALNPSPLPQFAEAGARHARFMRLLMATVALLVASYSALPHKELRFIYPALPPCLLVAAACFVHEKRIFRYRVLIVQLTVVTFCGFVGYTAIFYQRGSFAALHYIRTAPPLPGVEPGTQAVHVLTPCHWSPAFSSVHGVVAELVLNNCSIELAPADPNAGLIERPKRLPMEHHLWIDYPLEFALWVYLGVDPAEGAHIAAEQRRDGAFNDPLFHRQMSTTPESCDFRTKDEGMHMVRSRLQARSRTLPHRFVIFESYAAWLEPTFLGPNGYRREASFEHQPYDPGAPGEGQNIEVWQRVEPLESA